MDRLITYIRYSCLGLIIFLSACIRDGQDPCPPVDPSEYYSYIRFVYDYNMAFEDLFHRQVSNIDLYLFDEDGIYIGRLTDEAEQGMTFPKGYILGLPEMYKEACQFVAFPGVNSEHALISSLTPYSSTIDELELKLHGNGSNSSTSNTISNALETSLSPLWHGCIAQIPTRVGRNDTTIISLTKNTNKLRIALQSMDESVKFDINEFSFCLEAANNRYDAYNNTTGSDFWQYLPFLKENNEGETVGVAELHTMRLMAGQQNRLTIRHLPTATTVLTINLNTYLEALKMQEYTRMELQEYMDREDQYKLLVFLTPSPVDPTGTEMKWLATQISINDWVCRDQINEF